MLKHICGFVTRDIDANTHETAEILGLKAMDGPVPLCSSVSRVEPRDTLFSFAA